MPHRVIDTLDDLHDFTRFLGNLKLPVTVEWVQGRDRSRDQNALQWLWATEVAQQRGDTDPAEVQADWKLRHGVPILRADSETFRGVYDRCLKPLSYEEKVTAMRDLDFPITSVMKVRQMVRYLDAVQRECLEQGFRITDPDPMLGTYNARYRAKEAVA